MSDTKGFMIVPVTVNAAGEMTAVETEQRAVYILPPDEDLVKAGVTIDGETWELDIHAFKKV